jgi:hypothetical protein
MSDRAALRGVVLCEDKLTEQFARKLLSSLGFDTRRRIRFATAPAGSGSGEAWVRLRYPHEVRELRSKRHQRDLCLLAIRDGDRFGTDARKRELDEQLVSTELAPRQDRERIATPVPTWSIETWLLALLGADGLHEGEPVKAELVRRHGERLGEAIAAAVRAWTEGLAAASALPSLRDGVTELARLSD